MIKKEIRRCTWIDGKPDYYVKYHDKVWGKIVDDDQALFKWLSLEIFHIGLSWKLVLSKYEPFMESFDHFDYKVVANYDDQKIDELMANDQIIRYRKKIEAIIHNAQQFQTIQKEYGSFFEYLWHFTDHKQIIRETNKSKTRSKLSDKIAQDLKAYDFKFIGSVTIYSYLQAIGVINDHDLECDFR